MKDKIKKEKTVDDFTTLSKESVSDLAQCPKCMALFNITKGHQCHKNGGWWGWGCSVCHSDLSGAKRKIISPTGRTVTYHKTKKYYNLMDKIICWECAFRLVKEFTHDIENTTINRKLKKEGKK